MNIEEVRTYALGLGDDVTEDLFARDWISWRVSGKWFMLMYIASSEPTVAVKIEPEQALALQEHYDGVRPAYHMNKRHWYDLYLDRLGESVVKEQIAASYALVRSKLPKRMTHDT